MMAAETMKDKFATFAEMCEHRTSEIDFEPPIGSGEWGGCSIWNTVV